MKHEDLILKSVAKLSKAFKYPMEALPIFIDSARKGPVAYTSADGIWLNLKVIEKDPKNVHVYLAHEVFHYVVNNHGLTHKYPHLVVNLITDYKINELLHTLFGYDVSAVKFQGLLNRKWFGMTLDQIGQALLKRDTQEVTCSAEGLPHPRVAECAAFLRKRYVQHLSDIAPELFYLTRSEERTYSDVTLRSNNRSALAFDTVPLDKHELLKGIWYALWHKKPIASRTPGPCSMEQAFLYSLNLDRLREATVGKASDSLWAARKIFNHLGRDHGWILNKQHKAKTRLHEATDKLRYAKTKLLKKKAALRFARAKTSHDNAVALQPLAKLLKTHPVVTQTSVINYSPSSLASVHKKPPSLVLPPVRVNETVKRVRLLVKGFGERFVKLQELMDDMRDQLGDMEGIDQLAEGSSPPEDTDQNEQEGPAGSEESEDEGAELSEDSEPDTDKDSEEETKVKSKPKKGKKGSSDTGNPVDAESSGSSETPAKPGPGGTKLSQAKSAAGKGKGTSVRDKLMDNLNANFNALASILEHMREVSTLLAQIRSRNRKTHSEGPDATYEYGNDLGRAATEEIALLANKSTRLDFLVKLSNHQLLLHSPQEKRRSSVILCLDTSGSMAGEFYNKAAGFCLAVMRYMQKEKRGVALLTFDSSKCKEYVADIGKNIDAPTIIDILTSPSYGGTDFDVPLLRSQEIKREYGWKTLTTFLVTDGYCGLRSADLINQQKTNQDRIVVACVSSDSASSLAPVADEVQHLKRKGTTLEMVKAAHTLF
jgi:uncharacterized protein with von Willebrand factor type A (vWA) domain